jgi:hypothetical protein
MERGYIFVCPAYIIDGGTQHADDVPDEAGGKEAEAN